MKLISFINKYIICIKMIELLNYIQLMLQLHFERYDFGISKCQLDLVVQIQMLTAGICALSMSSMYMLYKYLQQIQFPLKAL